MDDLVYQFNSNITRNLRKACKYEAKVKFQAQKNIKTQSDYLHLFNEACLDVAIEYKNIKLYSQSLKWLSKVILIILLV